MIAESPTKGRVSQARYGSDIVVDVLRDLGVEYVSLNPGASFRGLHDSLVNYGGDASPHTILCTHEGIAIAIAHGYGRAAGKPMASAVHNIVGLLHGTNAIFNAWLQHAGLIVLGGTGPMAVEQRRPWIDWIHTALVQGNAVRDYVKWDDQPASVPGFVDSLIRAYQIAVAEPQGPVYVCFDAALQEMALDEQLPIPDPSSFAQPSRPQADARLLEQTADLLLSAERPVVIADYLGKAPEAVEGLLRLAETLSLPVIAQGNLFNFPSRHPLNLSDAPSELLQQADVILSLDVYDIQQTLTAPDWVNRTVTDLPPAGAKIIDISLRQYHIHSWSTDWGRLYPVSIPITADTAQALPALADLCARKLEEQPDRKPALAERAARLSARHDELVKQAEDQASRVPDTGPLPRPAVAKAFRDVVQNDDWVIACNDLRGWGRRLWDMREPHQYASSSGGTGNGYAVGLGVALANKNTGRLTVNFQADGDLMYNPGALWTAANHQIPLLSVMYNNRSYYNDGQHQKDIAGVRDRPVENWGVSINIENPYIDYATLAKSMGVYAEGPIERADDLIPALERARKVVVEQGLPAIVDVVTEN